MQITPAYLNALSLFGAVGEILRTPSCVKFFQHGNNQQLEKVCEQHIVKIGFAKASKHGNMVK